MRRAFDAHLPYRCSVNECNCPVRHPLTHPLRTPLSVITLNLKKKQKHRGILPINKLITYLFNVNLVRKEACNQSIRLFLRQLHREIQNGRLFWLGPNLRPERPLIKMAEDNILVSDKEVDQKHLVRACVEKAVRGDKCTMEQEGERSCRWWWMMMRLQD